MKISGTTKRQWITFGIVAALYLLFLYWMRSWWGLIVLPFIFDAYITHLIPWGFWQSWKSERARNAMSWVDAIVFALVAVYFVNLYVFQNYRIPSSSLEKSLLVGDCLLVSKMSYGPRVPNTPLAMPLTQHTLPVLNTKSYSDWPLWPYKRVAGLGKIKLGDIVVFNFPAGDTIALNYQQTDFYSMAYAEGRRQMRGQVNLDALSRQQQRLAYSLYYAAGSRFIHDNPELYGKVVARPVDRRENYVKRCVGLPGDTLQIIDAHVYLNGSMMEDPEDMQLNYFVQTNGRPITAEQFKELGISKDDRWEIGSDGGWERILVAMGLDKRMANGRLAPIYNLPLTRKMLQALESDKQLVSKIVMEPESDNFVGDLYPLNLRKKWNRNNYGPVWIPKKGATVKLTADNLPIYERCIQVYEGNDLQVDDDGNISINGQRTDEYTFQMDYYWMMGDNRHKSADSRYWGFVPEDHVVGKPLFVWFSLDKDYGLFNGGIRWNRLLKWVHS